MSLARVQFRLGFDATGEDFGAWPVVGGALEHVATLAVGDPQNLGPIVVIAAAFPPQVGGLDGRHQHLLGADGVLFLTHDPLDLLHHPEPHGQPRIDAGAGLPDHAGAQHQPVRDDLRLGGRLLQGRQEKAGQAHGFGHLNWQAQNKGSIETRTWGRI